MKEKHCNVDKADQARLIEIDKVMQKENGKQKALTYVEPTQARIVQGFLS